MNDSLDRPEVSEWFWDLIESADKSYRRLSRKLETLDAAALCRYQIEVDEAKGYVHPCYCEYYREYLDYCSEDHGDYFAAWVIAQGREFYELVRTDPSRIREFMDTYDAVESGCAPELDWSDHVDEYSSRVDLIAFDLYEKRFGGDLAKACYTSRGEVRR